MAQKAQQPVGLPKKPILTQQMMRDYLLLEANAKLVEKRYEDAKDEMIKLFKENPDLRQEAGDLFGELVETPQQRAAWKEEFIKLNGQAKADEISKAAPITYRRSIKIKVRATVKI